MGRLFYRLHRYHVWDVPAGRWLVMGLLLLAGAMTVGWLPGGWVAGSGLLALVLLYWAVGSSWRRRGYVAFAESPRPEVTPNPLAPSAKLPIRASGFFGVEGKHAHFTWLQGYFRTFATREHALLCLVQPDRVGLIASWPEKDIGMWYLFVKPGEVDRVRWGQVRYGGEALTCIAVDHHLTIPKTGRFSRERTLHKTAYIAVPQEADALAILADLLWQPGMPTTIPAPQSYLKPAQPASLGYTNGSHSHLPQDKSNRAG